jgi:hypothetical protein
MFDKIIKNYIFGGDILYGYSIGGGIGSNSLYSYDGNSNNFITSLIPVTGGHSVQFIRNMTGDAKILEVDSNGIIVDYWTANTSRTFTTNSNTTHLILGNT